MSDKAPKGLGMGLQALLGEAKPSEAQPRSGVREIEIARIRPNPNQPRTHFDEDANSLVGWASPLGNRQREADAT